MAANSSNNFLLQCIIEHLFTAIQSQQTEEVSIFLVVSAVEEV